MCNHIKIILLFPTHTHRHFNNIGSSKMCCGFATVCIVFHYIFVIAGFIPYSGGGDVIGKAASSLLQADEWWRTLTPLAEQSKKMPHKKNLYVHLLRIHQADASGEGLVYKLQSNQTYMSTCKEPRQQLQNGHADAIGHFMTLSYPWQCLKKETWATLKNVKLKNCLQVNIHKMYYFIKTVLLNWVIR